MTVKVITIQYVVETNVPDEKIEYHVRKGGTYLGDVYDRLEDVPLKILDGKLHHPIVSVVNTADYTDD